MMARKYVRIHICGGDNMLGRAIGLTLHHRAPGEATIRDSVPAQRYLDLSMHESDAEMLSLEGMRGLNTTGNYLWGALMEPSMHATPPPDLCLLNLETAVTDSLTGNDVPQKGINYHMHSANLPEVMKPFAGKLFGSQKPVPLVISFANNHALDWGRNAFQRESLHAFSKLPQSIHMVGAGRNSDEATAAARVSTEDGVEIDVLAFASEDSGTLRDWEATADKAGIAWLPAMTSHEQVDHCVRIVQKAVNRLDNVDHRILILSVHMGPNWAYRSPGSFPDNQEYRRQFSHRVIDELGVDVLYAHSSHHIRGMEVYNSKFIMYGAGDFCNDYGGFANKGDHLFVKYGALFVVDLDAETGDLHGVSLVPFYMGQCYQNPQVNMLCIVDPV